MQDSQIHFNVQDYNYMKVQELLKMAWLTVAFTQHSCILNSNCTLNCFPTSFSCSKILHPLIITCMDLGHVVSY